MSTVRELSHVFDEKLQYLNKIVKIHNKNTKGWVSSLNKFNVKGLLEPQSQNFWRALFYKMRVFILTKTIILNTDMGKPWFIDV